MMKKKLSIRQFKLFYFTMLLNYCVTDSNNIHYFFPKFDSVVTYQKFCDAYVAELLRAL